MPNRRRPTVTEAVVLPLVTGLGGAGKAFQRELASVERLDAASLAAWQLGRLQTLLERAQAAPFQRERLAAAGCAPADLRTLADLSRLPLLEKTDLTDADPDGLLTHHPRWRHTVRTSGTTGRPLTLHANFGWWARALARRRFLFARHGIHYGAREGRCWGRGAGHTGPSLKDRLGSRRTFQFAGTTESALRAEAETLLAFAPSYLYGYPSIVRQAATAWRDLQLPPPPLQGIVLTAERVSPADQRFIAEVFACPVWREYGCSETDIIAFDCEHGASHVLSDHLILEVHEPRDGVGEAVVTDLDNTLMPLIRYRLGDRIRLATDPCACGRTTPVIATIEGRTGEARYLYLPDGRQVHTVLFAYLFEDLAADGLPVRQFKVRQTALDALVVHLDGGGAVLAADQTDRIAAAIRERVGAEIDVSIVTGPLADVPGTKWNYFDPLPPEQRPPL